MVALDTTAEALTALPPARALAKSFAGELHLVSVEMPVSPRGRDWELTQDAYLDKRKRELEEYLERSAAPLRQEGFRVSTEVLPLGSTVARLLEEVAAFQADALVLYSHGRSGLSRLIFGSTAEELNRRASCPILVVHPPDDPEEPIGEL